MGLCCIVGFFDIGFDYMWIGDGFVGGVLCDLLVIV